MTYVRSLMKKDKPTIRLYESDLPAVKNMDVDDTCELIIKVKAVSKYRDDVMDNEKNGNPMCITFEIQKVSKQ